MEFLRSINLIRQTMPFPFYALLFGVPGALFALLYAASIKLSSLEGSFVNIYTVAMFCFLAFINFCFWKKLHWQRLGDNERAQQWCGYTDKMALVLFITILASGQ